MPPSSSVKDFIDALRTGKTKITKTLDHYFRAPASLSQPIKDAFDNTWNDLPTDLETEMLKHPSPGIGVDPEDIAHINQWDKVQLNDVRKALKTAIQNNTKVEFFWEVHSDKNQKEQTDTSQAGVIIFRSHREKVKIKKPTTGEIGVDVL